MKALCWGLTSLVRSPLGLVFPTEPWLPQERILWRFGIIQALQGWVAVSLPGSGARGHTPFGIRNVGELYSEHKQRVSGDVFSPLTGT